MMASVVIPTFNGGALFDEVLGGVMAQQTDFFFDVLCIDSGSSDETVETVRRHGARLISIEPGTFNHGLTRNRAIAECGGDLIALLVQDATPTDGWLAALARGFERSDCIAGAYARQLPRPDCNPFIKARLEQWVASRTEPVIQQIESQAHFDDLAPIDRLQLIGFDDVSAMVRRDVWQKHPYRERNFGEDLDWAKRVLLDGWQIAFEPDATVVHSHNRSVVQEFRRLYCDHANLRELVDLVQVQGPGDVIRQGFWGLRHYVGLLLGADEPAHRKLAWLLYMLPFPFAENLAQFMGARSMRWAEEHAWYPALDARIRRGI